MKLLLVRRNYLLTQSNCHGEKLFLLLAEEVLYSYSNSGNPTSATSSEPSAMLTISVDTTKEFETLVTQIGQNLSAEMACERLATDENTNT